MAQRSKTNDDDQVVRLPVSIRPASERWSSDFVEALGQWDEPIERPRARPMSERNDPFK
ncbi:MAG TPA: hypothetical protein VFV49_15990 [Thermoanaerobaculia bacterium]|nr:hypothetical protein [Thermoanaerobaculia bacterium]